MKPSILIACVASCLALFAPVAGAEGGIDCATVSASTRNQAYGYAHVVTLTNQCQRPVACEVWTNVDPTPRYTLQAKPGQSAEVTTRAGSPSRDVSAGKLCRYL